MFVHAEVTLHQLNGTLLVDQQANPGLFLGCAPSSIYRRSEALHSFDPLRHLTMAACAPLVFGPRSAGDDGPYAWGRTEEASVKDLAHDASMVSL